MKIIKIKHLILYLVLASCITPLVRSMDTGDFLKWVVDNDDELDEFTSTLDTVNPPSLVATAHNNEGNAPLQPSELNTMVPSSLMAIMRDYPALPAQVNNPDINKGPKKRKRPNQENELLNNDDQRDSPAPKRRKTGAEQLVAVTALTFQSQQDNEPTAMDIQQKQCQVPDCTETCIDKTELTKHLLTNAVKISTPPAQYQCPLCDTKSKRKDSLKKHIQTHTGDKPYKCNHPRCNYAANRKSTLKNHKLTHTGEKPYECDHDGCEYAATQKVNLNRHKRIHTGERPHKCDHHGCTYAFKQKSNLNTHKLTHTSEKTQKCDHNGCTYATTKKSTLNSHKLTHTGERPHKCDHDGCEYATTQKCNLNRHKRTCKFRT